MTFLSPHFIHICCHCRHFHINSFFRSSSQNAVVKKLLKLVHVCQSYQKQTAWLLFITHKVVVGVHQCCSLGLGRLGLETVSRRFLNVSVSSRYCHSNVSVSSRSRDSNVSVSSRSRHHTCLLYTSPSPRDGLLSRMPSSA